MAVGCTGMQAERRSVVSAGLETLTCAFVILYSRSNEHGFALGYFIVSWSVRQGSSASVAHHGHAN